MSRQRRKQVLEGLQNDGLSPSHKPDTAHQRKQRNFFVHIGCLLKKLALLLFVFYCLLLFMLYTSPTFRHQLVYLNYLVSPFSNYADPTAYQLSSTRNFYIQGQEGKLGVWHIPAKGSTLVDDGKPIVLYMHGNAYSRVARHRVATYKVLSSLGCHVIAFDYRGFGDSDGSPTEQGVVDDSLKTFQWILANTNRSPVFLWGHSLGSAVAVKLSQLLTETNASVTGVILEAPFNNMREGAFYHPLATPYRFLPFFQDTLQEINEMFKTDELISSIKYNILIIHDRSDKIIQLELGKKLYEAALKRKKESQVIEFKEFRGFSHTNLYASPDLPEILRKFMKLER